MSFHICMLNMLCDDRTMFIPLFRQGADAAQHSYMQKKVQVVSQPYSVKNSSSLAQCFSFRNMSCLCKFSLHNRKCTQRFYYYNWVLLLSWWLRKINSYKHLLIMFVFYRFHARLLQTWSFAFKVLKQVLT